MLLALGLLLAGVFTIAFCEQIGRKLDDAQPPAGGGGGTGSSAGEGGPLLQSGPVAGGGGGSAAAGGLPRQEAQAYEEPTQAAFYKGAAPMR